MKSLVIIILLAISLSSAAFAKRAWVCVGKTEADSLELSKLKLRSNIYLKHIGVLTLKQEKYCGHITHERVLDLCKFQGNKLFVNEKSSSLLETRKKTKIKLTCEEEEIIEPQGGVGGSN